MTPTVDQLRNWYTRLYALTGEMQSVYGPPGDNNPRALDAAVQVATYVAYAEYERSRLRELERGSLGI